MPEENLLISACLAGIKCKYSGGSNALPEAALKRLREKYRLIPVCPEVAGGLTVPRDPSEIIGERVFSNKGSDVTEQYLKGAETALRLAEIFGCRKALMKENSPSCGSGSIYDGSFSGVLIPGDGVTARKLKECGILVFGESSLEQEKLI